VRALEQLFLVVRLPAWHANLGHRVIRSAKLHIADTGMLCSLLGVDTDHLTEDGILAGIVLHLGPETTSLGDRLTAVPLMGLWSV